MMKQLTQRARGRESLGMPYCDNVNWHQSATPVAVRRVQPRSTKDGCLDPAGVVPFPPPQTSPHSFRASSGLQPSDVLQRSSRWAGTKAHPFQVYSHRNPLPLRKNYSTFLRVHHKKYHKPFTFQKKNRSEPHIQGSLFFNKIYGVPFLSLQNNVNESGRVQTSPRRDISPEHCIPVTHPPPHIVRASHLSFGRPDVNLEQSSQETEKATTVANTKALRDAIPQWAPGYRSQKSASQVRALRASVQALMTLE